MAYLSMVATVLLGLLLPLGQAGPVGTPTDDVISGPMVQVVGFGAMERNLESDGYHYDVYVKSNLSLTCMVIFSGKDVSLDWTFPQTSDEHEIHPITFPDGGDDKTAVRILKINNARIEDSGPYTCFARREGQNEALANTTYIHFIENGKELNHMSTKKNKASTTTTPAPKTTPTTLPTTTTALLTTTTTIPTTTTTLPTTTTTLPTTTTPLPTTTTPPPTTTTPIPTTTTTIPTTTTTLPTTTTTLPTTTTTLPTTTTTLPTTTTTIPTTTTTLPTTTTTLPTTTTTPTTTEAPTTTPKPTTEVPTTTPAPTPAPHHFDWVSFLAGIMLIVIIAVIALVVYWIFKKMKERSFAYQTL